MPTQKSTYALTSKEVWRFGEISLYMGCECLPYTRILTAYLINFTAVNDTTSQKKIDNAISGKLLHLFDLISRRRPIDLFSM